MRIDKNEFFRQATMRICGSLDIETAIWRCLLYLETVMPVTGMNLHLFETGMGTMKTIAQATRYKDEQVKLNSEVKLPAEAKEWVEHEWAAMKMQDVIIFNRPELDPVTRAMTRIVGKPDTSNMVMRLETEDRKIGALVMYVKKKDQYTHEHAQLLTLLHDPFAIAMSNALKHQEVLRLKEILTDDNKYLHQELLKISGEDIIGKDKGLRRVMEMVKQIAPLNSPLLLLGETGVGKEVIANAIHYSSQRKNGPFIKVNCGAIPESLIDSELFGHEKGAFTGALNKKRGRFERAHQGTLLLDEIGELPPQAQVRLLRVLQNKKIERVGGTTPIHVDIRIIAATHRNLEQMVNAQKFREDLWFRLNVFPINIPPLRERKEDIPDLIRYFLERKSRELKYHLIPVLAPGTIDRLTKYHWQGNVRELQNVVERALIHHHVYDKNAPLTFEGLMNPELIPVRHKTDHEIEAIIHLDDAMRLYIRKALETTKWHIYGNNGAAKLLGINPNTLRSRMKKMGIPFKSHEKNKAPGL